MNEYSTKWYYLKGGSWLGPIEDEEKKELLKFGVYPHCEEDCFDDFDVRIYRTRGKKYHLYDDETEEELIEIVDNGIKKNRRHKVKEVEEAKEERVKSIDDNIEEENDEKNRINIDWEEEKEVEQQKDSKLTVASDKEYQDDDEDVLAITDDDFERWNPEDFTNIEDSDDEFDELTVFDSELDDKTDDDDSVLDDEDIYDGSELDDEDLDIWDESDSSDEQDGDLAFRFNDQAERLEVLEEGLAQVRRKLDALEEAGKSRSAYFEERTDVFDKTYADLAVDVHTLSAKLDAYDVNEWKAYLDAQDERLRFIEGNLERIDRRVDKIFQDSANRSDALEKKTDVLSETCGKFGSDVQVLSTRISVFDTNAWRVRLDDQAEDMAIIRERITGIERRVNGTEEKIDRRIGDLEEKVDKYEIANNNVVSKVNVFETSIQSLENSVRAWDSISCQVDSLQRKQEAEALVSETTGLSAIKKSVGNLESKLRAFQTRFDSFEREVNNAEFIYESRFVKLEKAGKPSASDDFLLSNDASSKIQNLQLAVERIDSSLLSLSNLEEIVAKLQSEPCPSEARVNKLEDVAETFKSSLEGQGQFFLEQTRNLSSSIRSYASDLTEKVEQTQFKVQSLDACVRRLEEESTGTAFMSRLNQLFTKFQKQNKEQKEEIQEENRRLRAYVDEQRQSTENLVKEFEQKTTTFRDQSDLVEKIEQTQFKVQSLDACVQRLEEESTGTAFMSRLNQLFTQFQKQNKEQKEENRRFQAYVEEQRQAMENLVKEFEQKTAAFTFRDQETSRGDEKTNENSTKQSRGFFRNMFGGGRDDNEEKK